MRARIKEVKGYHRSVGFRTIHGTLFVSLNPEYTERSIALLKRAFPHKKIDSTMDLRSLEGCYARIRVDHVDRDGLLTTVVVAGD